MSIVSRRSVTRATVTLLAITMVLGACSDGSDKANEVHTTEAAKPSAGTLIDLRPLHVADKRIVDDQGRQILLRGANVNALGEYAQADPRPPPPRR